MRERKLELMVLGVMAAALISFAVIALMILLPFEPLTYYSLSAPTQACSQETLDSDIDYYLDENEFDAIQSMDVQSSWIAEDVPGVATGTERIITEVSLASDQLEPGRTTRQGRTLRIAPIDPGVWRLKLRHIVRGGPRIQEVVVTADESTTVLDKDDPGCEVGSK